MSKKARERLRQSNVDPGPQVGPVSREGFVRLTLQHDLLVHGGGDRR